MKHRRTQTYDTYSQKNQKIILGESQQEQAHQCETHADGEGIGTGMLIGIESCERLQDRRCHLENQRDDARLETMGEKETVAALRGEAEALKRQNQSLMAALSGNKQTGGQNA